MCVGVCVCVGVCGCVCWCVCEGVCYCCCCCKSIFFIIFFNTGFDQRKKQTHSWTTGMAVVVVGGWVGAVNINTDGCDNGTKEPRVGLQGHKDRMLALAFSYDTLRVMRNSWCANNCKPISLSPQ